MKNVTVFTGILFIFNFLQANCQCVADAGSPKIVCVNLAELDTTQIGGNTPTGGIAPYTYSWQASHSVTIGSATFTATASDFLDDTTLNNPSIVSTALDVDFLDFILTVTDANSQVCKDTVRHRFSNVVSTLSYTTHFILAGDSVYLNMGTNIQGGIAPYSYLWYPNHGLSDSTSATFWAKPDYSISYSAIVTDSAGCKNIDPDYYRVIVGYASIDEPKNLGVIIYPNPARDIIYIRIDGFDGSSQRLNIYDAAGKLCFQKNITSAEISVDISSFAPGVYQYQIGAGALSRVGKLVIK